MAWVFVWGSKRGVKCFVLGSRNGMLCNVHGSRNTLDVLSRVANLCGSFVKVAKMA